MNNKSGKIISIKISFSKREKIIIATALITIALIYSTQISNFIFLKQKLLIFLGITAYFLSLWALWEGMSKVKAITLLILPTLFTISVASFYFLLPVRWLTRIPLALIFGLSFYLLLLSQNVFNVAAIRTIPLYRVASTTSFLFSVFTSFFLFNVVYALNLAFFWNALICFIISFVLILPVLWSIKMEEISPTVMFYSFLLALPVGEAAVALSFWPLAPTVWSLSLSTVLYVLLGLALEQMRERLSSRSIKEFSALGILVLLFIFFVTSWTG